MAPPNGPVAGQPVFTPIVHPELRRLGRKHIHTFLKERERYILRLNDAQASGSNVQPISLKASVDPDLPLSMVEFGEFEGVENIEDITDEILQAWLDGKDDISFDSVSAEDLNAAVIQSVRINVNEPDAEMRIKSLFMDYKTFLRFKKWDSLIERNPKLAVSHICSLLKPPALQSKIESDLSLGQYELRKEWLKFYKYVLEQAVECDKFVSIKSSSDTKATSKTSNASSAAHTRDRTPRITSERPPSSGTGQDLSRKQTPAHSNRGNTATSQRQTDRLSSRASQSEKETSIAELPDCLNTKKCKGKHLLKDCPVTSPEERKEILQEYYNNQSKNRARLKSIAFDGTDQPHTCNGRYRARLADKVDVTVNGDTGADYCAISESHLSECADHGIFVQVLPLSHPIRVSLALGAREGEPEFVYEAKKKARISTTLFLPVGPLRLRNVEYLVFDQDMTEILLSGPILKSMGFDLDAHLALVRDVYHETDFSHIATESSKLGLHLLSNLRQDNDTVPFLDEDGTNTHGDAQSHLPTDSNAPNIFGDAIDDDPFRHDDEPVTGDEDPQETRNELNTRYEEAVANGLPEELQSELHSLLSAFSDIFRTRMGSDPPASVAPMQIRLKPDATPIRVRVRRYSPLQAAFLRKKTDELLRLGLIVRNNTSPWACAPLLVPKDGPEKFRFTVDLRPVNSQTVPFAWPMPNLETATTQLARNTCFALIDLCHCYWQFPIDADSRECQSFITPDGVFTPTRVLHGQTNATAYVQSTVQAKCLSLRDVILQWLDDILFHCKTAHDLITALREFFTICRTHRFKLHAAKCQFFLQTVHWCGRSISKDGVRLDPRRLQALLNMPSPTTGDQLQQFLCAANWMRSVIPRFNSLVTPLHEIVEEVFAKCKRRTKQAASKVYLSETAWGHEHVSVFDSVKEALRDSITLSHPDPEKLLCLFTDASERNWAGVLTQIPPSDADQPFESQRHEPLSFLSGSFKGSSARWSTAEKEAFAIVESVARLDYMLLRPEGFMLFTDHKNLVFIFDPATVYVNIQRHVASKIERWAIFLSSFRYTVVHITGEENCWADLLSRWGTPNPSATSRRLSALLVAPVAPDLDPDFTWPSAQDISQSQESALKNYAELPNNVSKNGGIYKNAAGAVWIPSSDTALITRIAIIGHCGRSGHRGKDTTLQCISEYFFWSGMKADIKAFCNTCLHCVATSTAHKVPRPMAHALHADTPNELLHFDYLYMSPSTTGEEYVLIIKDDASSYTWLEPCTHADAETTVKTLLRWFSSFGVSLTWCSDRGSHFKNKVITDLNRALHAHHHFTTAYCPQSNGTVETVYKEVLRACRGLLSQFRLREREWPAVIMLVQSIINNSKRSSMGNIAPITAFTGQAADNPLRTILPPGAPQSSTIDFVKAQRIANIGKLRAALDAMHKDISVRKTRRRNEAVLRHNTRTHIQPVNFEVGDFVMVAKQTKKTGHKLQVRWMGPRRVTRALSDLVYECEDLISGMFHTFHSNRLKHYADSSLNVTEEFLDSVEHNTPHLNSVEKLLDLKFNANTERYEVRIKWRGFDYEDPTWEPLSVMHEDIPDKLEAFLTSHRDRDLVKSARESLEI